MDKEQVLRELVAYWKSESKRVKELADKERSKSGRESLMAQSVRYWMCADELEEVLNGKCMVKSPSNEKQGTAT